MGILKSFVIQGFKTFPERISLGIDDGVTAVVGPNGSGKSNIGEAMRWVLGEQNARVMRCEKKMEEVIFHGTETRAALGFAEVSLHLDNSGERFGSIEKLGAELCITRRLNRAGESDYFINRREVRLKDVQALLMDTGLGAGGYSIIAQGMIHRIMSEKPLDRRRVFEEAAGIAKYRQSKEESQRKLALAEQNLLRVSDKLEELEPQMERLGKQAETAKRYLLLRDELRGLEVNLWLDSLGRLRAGKTKLGDLLRQTREDLEAGKKELETLEASAAALDDQITDIWQQAEHTQRELTRLTEEKAAAENEGHVAENDLGHLRRAGEELNKSAGDAKEQALQLERQIKEREESLGLCLADIAALAEEQEALTKELHALASRTSDIGSAADALLADKLLRQEALQEARLRLAAMEAGAGERDLRRAALEESRAAKEEARASLEEAYQEALRSLTEAKERAAELDNIIGGYRLRERQRESKARDASEKLEALRRRRHEAESRYSLLGDMERQYDNNHAVQTVMNAGLRGVHGTVSELVRTEDEYAVAIEVALGGALHNIVVDTEEVAEAAIHLLKERRGGRATFAPLSTVRGEEMAELRGADAYLGIASRLVDCDERYRGIVRSLLGRVAVCRDLKAAIALSRRERNRFRIVTLDGQLIHAGGTMTGGSVGRRVGILSRRNELDALERDIALLEAGEAEAAKAAAEALRLHKAAVYEREVAESDKRQASEDAVARAAALQSARERLEALEREMALAEAELAALTEKRGEQEQGDAALREEIAGHESYIQAIDTELAGYSGGKDALQNEREGLGERQSSLRERQAALQSNRASLVERLEELRERLADISGGEEERRAKQEGYAARMAELETRIGQSRRRAGELSAALAEQRSALDALGERRIGLDGERSRLGAQIKERYRQNTELERAAAKTENQLQTNQSEEEAIVASLWEKYELSVSEAQKLRTEDSGARASRRVAELNREISALGSVNIDAIAEYEALGLRYHHLREQWDDAKAAKDDLDGIIADITGEMRTLFSAQFEQIRAHFTETFLEIFGGGEATLELDENADILESGVEIKAQPPGKKLRSISLLSGGEQSLCAIALYFAMFKVRPAPFCVLDEIDHDLDDVNVGRFAAYLKRLSSETQYLVITHRRGTMEQAATLYGVTTREPGISRVIRLQLADAERELGMELQ